MSFDLSAVETVYLRVMVRLLVNHAPDVSLNRNQLQQKVCVFVCFALLLQFLLFAFEHFADLSLLSKNALLYVCNYMFELVICVGEIGLFWCKPMTQVDVFVACPP